MFFALLSPYRVLGIFIGDWCHCFVFKAVTAWKCSQFTTGFGGNQSIQYPWVLMHQIHKAHFSTPLILLYSNQIPFELQFSVLQTFIMLIEHDFDAFKDVQLNTVNIFLSFDCYKANFDFMSSMPAPPSLPSLWLNHPKVYSGYNVYVHLIGSQLTQQTMNIFVRQ